MGARAFGVGVGRAFESHAGAVAAAACAEFLAWADDEGGVAAGSHLMSALDEAHECDMLAGQRRETGATANCYALDGSELRTEQFGTTSFVDGSVHRLGQLWRYREEHRH